MTSVTKGKATSDWNRSVKQGLSFPLLHEASAPSAHRLATPAETSRTAKLNDNTDVVTTRQTAASNSNCNRETEGKKQKIWDGRAEVQIRNVGGE